ncbi:MAG: hypothetical protein ACRD3M_09305, partial [Thermoanaerobaculia bacterium]
MNERRLLTDTGSSVRIDPGGRHFPVLLIALMAAACLVVGSAFARGDDGDGDKKRFCSQTANLLFRACGHEVQDDFWVASAKCVNVSDPVERAECSAEAKESRRESRQLCQEQLEGRLDACKSLGEGRYDPDFDPELFDDNFEKLPNPNPY